MSPGWVLVTGSARGFGRLTVATLVGHGFRVLAGVRKVADIGALMAEFGDAVHPLMLEVTDVEQLEEATATVEELTGDAGLAGLVNNAAAAPFGPIELTAPGRLAHTLLVNVVGVHAVTVAMLPALRRARGRIVNVSSVNGRVAIPNAAAYCASKFALEAWSDALRMELAPWGLHVVVVQPGAFDTTLRAEGVARMLADLEAAPPERRALYEPAVRRLAEFIGHVDTQAPHPQPVADAILEALTAPVPETRYAVGPDAAQIIGAAGLPDRERDALLLGMM